MREKRFFRNDVLKETAHGPVLYATRCRECGTLYFPSEQICARDLCGDMEEVEVPKYGKLYTYTVLYRNLPQYKAPHALGKVEFENGLVINAPIIVEDKTALVKGHEFKIGSRVETLIAPMWEDDSYEYVGVMFKIVAGPEDVGGQ